ncbi:hypothetical protein DRQ09_06425, partial [candidate division KSB1 bacterium]
LKLIFLVNFTILLIFSLQDLHSQSKKVVIPHLGKITDFDKNTWFDVNRIRMVVTNRGSYCWDLRTGNGGLEYPKGTGKLAMFAAGLWVFACVNDSLRCAIAEYRFDYGPGIMKDGTFVPDNPDFQVYKINRGDGEENPDWVHWKNVGVKFGAPVDDAGNPLIIGDQTLWTVFNDANPLLHSNFAEKIKPLGIEVQLTVFGFKRKEAFDNIVFLQWKIINKGNDYLKDAYIGLWFDPDLGDAFNDLVGCDPEYNLGFCYNADEADGVYVEKDAAVGVDLLKGVVDKNGDILNMTSFGKYVGGCDPRNSIEAYNYSIGKKFNGDDYIDPTTGKVSRYCVNGDPVLRTGWIDRAPTDRRMILGTGPFDMAPGDTQEIIAAIICAEGRRRLDAVSVLRNNDFYAQTLYNMNFEIYNKVPAPELRASSFNESILLYWDNKAELFNSYGYKFEGYNIYQGKDPNSLNEKNWKLIKSFDINNNIKVISDIFFNGVLGIAQEKLVQILENNGIQNYLRINVDYFNNENELINGKPYHYAVEAFAYNEENLPRMIKSEFSVISATPSLNFPGYEFDEYNPIIPVFYSQIDNRIPETDDSVSVKIIDPLKLNGHKYNVIFSSLNVPLIVEGKPILNLWHLIDITDNNRVILSNQWNKKGNENYAITNGFMVKVKGSCFNELKDVEAPWLYSLGESNTIQGRFLNGGADYGSYYFGSSINPEKDYDKLVPVEIRFSEYKKQKAYFYNLNTRKYTSFNNVPFTVWDIKNNVQLNCAVLEDTYKDTYDQKWRTYNNRKQEEPILVFGTRYSEIIDKFYTDIDIMRYPVKADILYFFDWSFHIGVKIPDGSKIKFTLTRIATENDIFSFTANKFKINPQKVKEVFKHKIRAVPNPYYGNSQYENSSSERKIMFTPLPQRCTIKIFNLAGILIKTINKDDKRSFMFWDVKSEYNTPISSGVYIFVVKSKELGQTIGKMAIFMENRF